MRLLCARNNVERVFREMLGIVEVSGYSPKINVCSG